MNSKKDLQSRNWLYARWALARKWLASDRLRRVRMVIFQAYILIALLLFAILAALATMFPVMNLDVMVTRELQEAPSWFRLLMVAVSWAGFMPQTVIITIVIPVLLYGFGLRWEGISALFAGFFTAAVNTLVKASIRRPRPTDTLVEVYEKVSGFSFPSGHVMFYTAFFGFLLFLVFALMKRRWLRTLLITYLLGLVVLVGPSRMTLGEHWGSDVLAGYLLGSLMLILSLRFYQWGKLHYFVPQPIAVTGKEDAEETPEERKELDEAVKSPIMPKADLKHVEKQVPAAKEAADAKESGEVKRSGEVKNIANDREQRK